MHNESSLLDELNKYKGKTWPSLKTVLKKSSSLREYVSLYPWIESCSQLHYCLSTRDVAMHRCISCGSPLKFNKSANSYPSACSKKCAKSAEAVSARINKAENTFLEKYGVKNPHQIPEVSNKIKLTCNVRFGGNSAMSSAEVREKVYKTNLEKFGCMHASQSPYVKEKQANTNVERYGFKSALQNALVASKTSKTNLERYGNETYMKTDDFKRKSMRAKEMKKLLIVKFLSKTKYYSIHERLAISNNSYCHLPCNLENFSTEAINAYCALSDKMIEIEKCTIEEAISFPLSKTFSITPKSSSKIEEDFYAYLKTMFKENDIKRQYSECRYPHKCDFYIASLDLFIEIQGTWTHGPHPYNERRDRKIIEEWTSKAENSIYYKEALHNFMFRDVEKRCDAAKNNLRFLEIFANDINEAKRAFKRYVRKF